MITPPGRSSFGPTFSGDFPAPPRRSSGCSSSPPPMARSPSPSASSRPGRGCPSPSAGGRLNGWWPPTWWRWPSPGEGLAPRNTACDGSSRVFHSLVCPPPRTPSQGLKRRACEARPPRAPPGRRGSNFPSGTTPKPSAGRCSISEGRSSGGDCHRRGGRG